MIDKNFWLRTTDSLVPVSTFIEVEIYLETTSFEVKLKTYARIFREWSIDSIFYVLFYFIFSSYYRMLS